MLYFKEAAAVKKSKSSSKDQVKISVGDHVSLSTLKKPCVVEKIRVLKTGKHVAKFNGNKQDVIVTFKGHDFEQNVWLANLEVVS